MAGIDTILSYGVIGLAALLALYAARLLKDEQKAVPPRPRMLKAIREYMFFALALSVIGLTAELLPTFMGRTQQHPPASAVRLPDYLIDVKTGARAFAGTNDAVYLTLYGGNSKRIRHRLGVTGVNDFAADSSATYSIYDSTDIGTLRRIDVALESAAGADSLNGWYVDYVIVHDMKQRRAVAMPVNDWLDDRPGTRATLSKLVP